MTIVIGTGVIVTNKRGNFQYIKLWYNIVMNRPEFSGGASDITALWCHTVELTRQLPNPYVERYYDDGQRVYATVGWDWPGQGQLIRTENAWYDDDSRSRLLASEIRALMGKPEPQLPRICDMEPTLSSSPGEQHEVARCFLSQMQTLTLSPLVMRGMREHPQNEVKINGIYAAADRNNIRKLACINLSLAALLDLETTDYENVVSRAENWSLSMARPYTWL